MPISGAAGGEVECIPVTPWDLRAAIRKLAGDDIERAVVEPEARAAPHG